MPTKLPKDMRYTQAIEDRLQGLLERSQKDEELREDLDWLIGKYVRLERKLDKISRISDRLQGEVLELNRQLRQAVTTDHLTGLLNRRGAVERLEAEASRAGRGDLGFCVLLLDLDHFKRINDTYGHDAGDLFLEKIAECLRTCLRQYDSSGRWGGEEFLVLLPGTNLQQAQLVAGKLLQAVRQLRVPLSQQKDAPYLHCTLSIGIARFNAGDHLNQVLACADQALYLAKNQGRDQAQTFCPQHTPQALGALGHHPCTP